jgi:hypothetical protein
LLIANILRAQLAQYRDRNNDYMVFKQLAKFVGVAVDLSALSRASTNPNPSVQTMCSG